jgi:hypothetical protein
MTKDDIIRMAREAHLDVYGLGTDHKTFMSAVECLAYSAFTAGALAEREACAKVCEELGYYAKHGGWGCADAIRARGQG